MGPYQKRGYEVLIAICLMMGLLSLISPAQSSVLADPDSVTQGCEEEGSADICEESNSINLDDSGYEVPVESNELKIMNWNIENLFDTTDDIDKEDATFLPLGAPSKQTECEHAQDQYKKMCFNTDWVPAKLKLKLAQIQRAVKVQGVLPDVMTLVEIENENVLKMLATELGYDDYRISDGPDRRGIDVAVMWKKEKITYVDHAEIDVSTSTTLQTRPILRVDLSFTPHLKQPVKTAALKRISIYVNHWPSQGTPPKMRAAVALILRKHLDTRAKREGDNFQAIVMGDFNTTQEEAPNAISRVLMNPKWKHALVDTQDLSEHSDNPMNGKMPTASYNYRSQWNRFDRFLLTKNLTKKFARKFNDTKDLEIIPESFRILGASFMTRKIGTQRVPLRYNFDATRPGLAGFSDHFPIVVKLRAN